MSDELAASLKETSEQVEVKQEESQLAAEVEAVAEQPKDNAEDRVENITPVASDTSVISDPSTQPSQDGGDIQDSQESFVSSGGISSESQQTWETGRSHVTESQQSWETCDGSGAESQQSCISKELPLERSVSNGGIESIPGHDNVEESRLEDGTSGGSGVESQQSCIGKKLSFEKSISNGGIESIPGHDNVAESATCGNSGEESQQGDITDAVGEQISQESAPSPGMESVGDTGLQLPAADDDASRRSSEVSVAPSSSYSGGSQETAVIGDSSRRNSQESAGPDAPVDPRNGVEDVAPAGPLIREIRGNEQGRVIDQRPGVCGGICDPLRPLSRQIRKSKTFLFFKLILLILPVSAFCIGLKYLKFCPANKDLPTTVMILGLIGFIFICCSLGLATRRMLCPRAPEYAFKTMMYICSVFFLFLFVAGFHTIHTISPSFDAVYSDRYCNIVLYYYAYHSSYIVLGIFALLTFIYLPTYNENIEGYERI